MHAIETTDSSQFLFYFSRLWNSLFNPWNSNSDPPFLHYSIDQSRLRDYETLSVHFLHQSSPDKPIQEQWNPNFIFQRAQNARSDRRWGRTTSDSAWRAAGRSPSFKLLKPRHTPSCILHSWSLDETCPDFAPDFLKSHLKIHFRSIRLTASGISAQSRWIS